MTRRTTSSILRVFAPVLCVVALGCVSLADSRDTRDRLAIAELASQYAWGVDTLDRGLLGRTFASGATAHYLAVGPNPMNLDERLEGFDAIYGWLHANLAHRTGTEGVPMHFVSNELVMLEGDTATLRFYMHNRASSVGGVYTVEARRTPDGWRIGSLLLEEQTWDASAYGDDDHAQQFFSPAETPAEDAVD
jgi:hypothetical protein